MKNIYYFFATLIFFTFMTSTVFAEDMTHHARVRLHGSTAQDSVGVSGVLELPDLPNEPRQVLGLLGLSINSNDYDVGLHLGSLVFNSEAVMTFDIRTEIDITDKLFCWTNLKLNDLTNLNTKGSLYGFGMIDYAISEKAPLALGFESENIMYFDYTDRKDYSIGPNLLVGVSDRARFELSYQKHSNKNIENQIWLRLDTEL